MPDPKENKKNVFEKIADEERKNQEHNLHKEQVEVLKKKLPTVERGRAFQGVHAWMEIFADSPHEAMETLEPTAGFWKALRCDKYGNLKITIDGEASKKPDYKAKSIGTNATRIYAPNSKRKQVIITNDGSTVVYIGFDKDVTTSNGIPLGKYDVFSDKVPVVHRGEIWGIVSAGTGDLRIVEYE